jgi:hypothetical protein
MHDAHSRRNVLASGVAVVLAAPLSALATASAADVEDWPEWAEWLATLISFQALCKAGMRRDTSEEEAEDDRAAEAMLDRLFALEDAMMARPVTTERHQAMTSVIWLWHMDRPYTSNTFDVRDLAKPKSDFMESWHMLACCRRAAVLLPEVPFIFPLQT